MTNEQSDWDVLCDHVDELMATGRYPSRHAAMQEAKRLHPELDHRPPTSSGATPARMGCNAEAQLTAAAKQIMAAKRTTFAQAYVQALAENPHLYQAYLSQHPQQTGGVHG